MKSFLQPSFAKIFLALFLFILASVIWRQVIVFMISDTFPYGFPLGFYLAWGPCPPGDNCSEFNWLWLILDLLIWYLVSALILKVISWIRKPR
jgi:hypothetical protein